VRVTASKCRQRASFNAKGKSDLAAGTRNFALQIIRLFPKFSRMTEVQVLAKQLLRSGTSVGANYREAYRGRSKAEFIAKCGDSLRELEETGYWLELLCEAGIGAGDEL
jgi:four helix bundle protein